MKRVAIITILFLFVAGLAFAVSYEDGVKAYESKDYKTAYEVFSKLAAKGDVKAQYNLGLMYNNGQGVPQDYKQAVIWFQKASEQGVAEAQYNLGVMYANGKGVPQDYTLAYMWLNLAAAGGYESAVNNRDIVAKKMTRKQIEKAQKMSMNWKAKTN